MFGDKVAGGPKLSDSAHSLKEIEATYGATESQKINDSASSNE